MERLKRKGIVDGALERGREGGSERGRRGVGKHGVVVQRSNLY